MELFTLLLPEILVTTAALLLFLMGVARSPASRRAVPWLALAGLLAGLVVAWMQADDPLRMRLDWTGSLLESAFGAYVKILAAAIGIFFVLLSWPTDESATGNPALRFGQDAAEFFGLILLSIAGLMLVGSANDTMLLFMAIELASIPTYVLVSVSRPLPAAQEAGAKYFYLGAMSAALMLLGFAYLYGATGTTDLMETGRVFAGHTTGLGYDSTSDAVFHPATWQVLGAAFVLLAFAFKLAAVPLHFYAGDVYTGAATPVTALLSFVPKAVGIVATIKVLYALGGNGFALPATIWKLLFAIAVLTMFVGNAQALLADNLKRVMAYSSIAHSGYMLVALTALAAGEAVRMEEEVGLGAGQSLATVATVGERAIAGVLFYLAAYGIMNAGVFGVLIMLPSRTRVIDFQGHPRRLPATSAETYDDIAGTARRHPMLAAAMAICCISLIGIPLTIGFLGKLYILRPVVALAGDEGVTPAGQTAMWWLVGITVLNAGIGAAYYLRIVAAMVLNPSPEEEDAAAEGQVYLPQPAPLQPVALRVATGLSVAGVLLFGFVAPAVDALSGEAMKASGAVMHARQMALPDSVRREFEEEWVVPPPREGGPPGAPPKASGG